MKVGGIFLPFPNRCLSSDGGGGEAGYGNRYIPLSCIHTEYKYIYIHIHKAVISFYLSQPSSQVVVSSVIDGWGRGVRECFVTGKLSMSERVQSKRGLVL